MSPDALKDLFEEVGVGLDWRLKAGETDEHECKENFGMKHAHNWLRPMAALANNRGGYLLFGVYDKGKKADDGRDLSHVVCGLKSDDFMKTDPVDFTKRVKAIFDPTPQFTPGVVTVGGKTVGVIHVRQHPSRPVIATKQEGEIREGDIFFRYPGQSSRVKYSDLRAILDDRDATARRTVLPMFERLLAIGPERAVIADLENGTLGDGKQVIQIDRTLLDQIAIIKEGEFKEKKGTPALRLVGDVIAVSGGVTHIKKGAVTRHDLITDFLEGNSNIDPKEYIRFAVESVHGRWVPLRYYAKLANLARAELVAFINQTKAHAERKAEMVALVRKKDPAWMKPSPKSAEILDALKKTHKVLEPKAAEEVGVVARALLGLPRDSGVPLKALLKSLAECNALATSGTASTVRRAMCRVDEVFFELD
jgi:hypothetical protein